MNKTIMFCALCAASAVIGISEPLIGFGALVIGTLFFILD